MGTINGNHLYTPSVSMTTEAKLESMEHSLDELKETVTQLVEDIRTIRIALTGDNYSINGGLLGELKTQKERIKQLEDEVKDLMKDKAKYGEYIKAISFVMSLVVTAVIGLIIAKFK